MYNINAEENEKAAKYLVDYILLWQDLLIKVQLLFFNFPNATWPISYSSMSELTVTKICRASICNGL